MHYSHCDKFLGASCRVYGADIALRCVRSIKYCCWSSQAVQRRGRSKTNSITADTTFDRDPSTSMMRRRRRRHEAFESRPIPATSNNEAASRSPAGEASRSAESIDKK